MIELPTVCNLEDITVGNEGGMAGAAIGQVETFDAGRESIAAYLE